ncbi:hypothetical protein BN946_scf184569.g14 [Trametes cinnabarina]|uniref:Uncharacterized protein n=1 Tax=Pycnoporus cinnabarinus TaxID=5643 RepID=A0A060S8A7_PYCCI|nr:hypothetical protein BN946_scf184569.g14 [Trametes cinnabarina]
MPGMTESSFAALLFNPGKCAVCGSNVNLPYYSFALRVHLCDRPSKCVSQWRAVHLQAINEEEEVLYRDMLQWIPRLERNLSSQPGKIYVLVDCWKKAIAEFKKAQLLGPDAILTYNETKQVLADAFPAQMEFYRKLVAWRDVYASAATTFTSLMQEAARLHSMRIGCSKWEIMQSPTYSTMYHAKIRCRERWLEPNAEFASIEQVVMVEVTTHKQRKLHKEREHILQERKRAVEKEYSRLKQDPEQNSVLPSFPEFRRLSVVKTFEASTSYDDPRITDPFISKVLKDNLEQWRAAARAALADVLGFPQWKIMSKRKLHPVDRLTARFRCKRCDASGKKADTNDSMDFAAACGHLCPHMSKKALRAHRWDAKDFAPDQQVIDGISSVLGLCGTTAEDIDSLKIVDSVGDRIQCTACSLTMDVRSVGRHRRRHQECSFALLSAEEAPALPPIEHGSTSVLLQKSPQGTAKRDEKVYGCRHCSVRPARTAAGGSSSTAGDQEQAKIVQVRPKWMSFNGLRSHLKEKHSVEHIADEDFYRQQDPSIVQEVA